MQSRVQNFKAASAGKSTFSIPSTSRVIAPKDMTLQQVTDNSLAERLKKYLSMDIKKLPDIPPELAELPSVTEDFKAVKEDFKDSERLEDPALIITRMDDENVAKMGRAVIPMLASGFSSQGVGGIFILAYHLRDPRNPDGYVLNGYEELYAIKDVTLDDMSNKVLVKVQEHQPLLGIGDIQAEAQAYSFIAASTIRMFTKSVDNFVKAFNHITLGYERFYGSRFPLTIQSPTVEALRSLAHYFNQGRAMRGTLYRLLYLGGSSDIAVGMRMFLYEIHIANTGLHIVSIFVRLCKILNCPTGILMTAINTKKYERQVRSLCRMMKLIMSDDEDHKRRMWRFGRLFSDTFMTPIQTKSCPTLVYILAYALKSEAAKTNQDILNIVQLEDVSPEKRILCEAEATKMLKVIKAAMV